MPSLKKILSLTWLAILGCGIAFMYLGVFDHLMNADAQLIYHKPIAGHWFGTDSLGRDLLARIFLGARNSLLVSFLATALSLLIAFLWGAWAAWLGGFADVLLMRLIDILMSMPAMFFVSLLAMGWAEPSSASVFYLILIIGITHWFKAARLIRAEIIKLRAELYIEAAISLGAKPLHIFIKHFWPQLRPTLMILGLYQIPTVMLSESFLSFVGFGINPPDTSWGLLLQEGWRAYETAPHLILVPSLFLFFTMWSLSSLVDQKIID